MVEAGDKTVPARQGTDILLLHVRFLDDRLMAKHLVKSCLKATVENLRGSVEKLSRKESVEGAHTAPQHSVGTRGTLLRGQFFPHCPKDFQQLLRLSKS